MAFVTYYSFVEYSHNDVFGVFVFLNSSALSFPWTERPLETNVFLYIT